MTPDELAQLPKLIDYWSKQMDKACIASGLDEFEIINAKIAICEAKRALEIAKAHNANAADMLRER